MAYDGPLPQPGGIFSIVPGQKPVDVSNTASPDGLPTWAPDGKSPAYLHDIKGFDVAKGCRIVVVSGGKGRPIPGVTADCDTSFSWGRNGLIAFNDLKSAVWTVKPDGSGLHKVMDGRRGLGAGYASLDPAWSPDGRMLAFGGGMRDGIYLAHADGSGFHAITKPGSAGDSYPAWSPDGKTIAFVRLKKTKAIAPTTSVMVVHSDGTGSRQLVTKLMSLSSCARPAWTPDGVSIVGAYTRIWAVPPGGSRAG